MRRVFFLLSSRVGPMDNPMAIVKDVRQRSFVLGRTFSNDKNEFFSKKFHRFSFFFERKMIRRKKMFFFSSTSKQKLTSCRQLFVVDHRQDHSFIEKSFSSSFQMFFAVLLLSFVFNSVSSTSPSFVPLGEFRISTFFSSFHRRIFLSAIRKFTTGVNFYWNLLLDDESLYVAGQFVIESTNFNRKTLCFFFVFRNLIVRLSRENIEDRTNSVRKNVKMIRKFAFFQRFSNRSNFHQNETKFRNVYRIR